MDENHSSTSDEEEVIAIPKPTEFKGTLSKWTNYIHGWQPRYIVLKEGTLSYYKSESETDYGCRGSVSIQKAQIQPHEFDECRLDVVVSADCVWYLRAENEAEKQKWVEELDVHKAACSGSGAGGLRRHGSTLSLMSNSVSLASFRSKNGRVLKEKILEIETYRDLLVKQVVTLQKFFDTCTEAVGGVKAANGKFQGVADLSSSEDDESVLDTVGNSRHLRGFQASAVDPAVKEFLASNAATALDFRGEALTFKSTTAGVLTTLQHCLELISQREEAWKKKLDKEMERRKRVEELYRSSLQEVKKHRPKLVLGGPDFEEGPHSQIGEEEFFDAVEAGLDKLDQEQLYFERLKHRSSSVNLAAKSISHRLSDEIEKVTLEQLQYAHASVEDGVWALFAEDGEMRMYKREEEIDGLAVDPLKAVHTVKGVTAREMCEHFYDPGVRLEWETTVEQLNVLERISDDTSVVLQIHKRVWPATQRDALFWSHIRKATTQPSEKAHDVWIVCNNSTEHSNFPRIRGHSKKQVKVNAQKRERHHFLINRVVDLWNSVSEDTVSSNTVEEFKVYLDKEWSMQEGIEAGWYVLECQTRGYGRGNHTNPTTDRIPEFIHKSNEGKFIRVGLTVSMVCQTYLDPRVNPPSAATRGDLTCNITYCAVVNPGGWAPTSALRAVYKREYPKFLKRFTQYVIDKCQDKVIRF